ncbi:MAG: electron transport complex subunit RsxC [Leptospiraceae bacterium]|nr:electron transport complex subunit RsxC [Leptospiraceae bacterium]
MSATFRHGIHPPENKEATSGEVIRRLRFAEYYSILLSQHAGKPARPVVIKGQEVERGQLIAEADGFMSVPMHAPVSGTVVDIALKPSQTGELKAAINIRAWPGSSQVVPAHDPFDVVELDRDEIIKRIQMTGMVGLGGAAFPTHVKFAPPPEKVIHTLLVNGCECEPYLTADHRVMLEMPRLVLLGTVIALKATGAGKAIIGVEDNKRDAAAALEAELARLRSESTKYLDKFQNIQIQLMQTKYPQGAEKMLITAALGKELPSGKLPADLGVMVSNVTTLAEIAMLVPYQQGLIERVITITGDGVSKPGNYIVPIGTPLDFVLDEAGLIDAPSREVIFGGPMMGMSVANLYTPITKAVSGILVLQQGAATSNDKPVMPCIKCGHCLSACPLHLNPSRLGMLARKDEFEKMRDEYNLFDCFECGSCSWTCPSNIPLVQYFRMAKKTLRKAK